MEIIIRQVSDLIVDFNLSGLILDYQVDHLNAETNDFLTVTIRAKKMRFAFGKPFPDLYFFSYF